jgi:hypothetical protein
MTLENIALLSRRSRLSVAVVIVALIGITAWTAGHFLQPAAPRHIVLASGLEDGLFHQYAKRYVEILARSGVTVEERMTAGAEDNLRLRRIISSRGDWRRKVTRWVKNGRTWSGSRWTRTAP